MISSLLSAQKGPLIRYTCNVSLGQLYSTCFSHKCDNPSVICQEIIPKGYFSPKLLFPQHGGGKVTCKLLALAILCILFFFHFLGNCKIPHDWVSFIKNPPQIRIVFLVVFSLALSVWWGIERNKR